MDKQTVLADLRANVESTMQRDGIVWGDVYLQNTDSQGFPGFPQILAALTKDGDYIKVDGQFFGRVRMN